MLAGCGGSQPPIGAPGAMPQSRNIVSNHTIAGDSVEAATSSYHVLYSFGGPPDGGFPEAGLIDVNGTLYGTTQLGGTYAYTCEDTSYYEVGCGTVFSITTSGSEKLLHSFGNGTDGAYPFAGLINIDGTLYGTTTGGGGADCYSGYSCGTAFSITAAGSEKVLHSFDGSDGANPSAGLLDVNNRLYGTTFEGGTSSGCHASGYNGCGTVFSITVNGKGHLLYSFGGGTNGRYPSADMIEVSGRLYGTTYKGGLSGEGIVFSITTRGEERALHSFGSGSDGAQPLAGLLDVKGRLYGTARAGGTYSRGTVFSMTVNGTEKVLHSFGSGTDGADPEAALIDVGGTLYGTTSEGGAYGLGTVFGITTAGMEKTLHSFGSGTDGSYPEAGLIDAKGTLYGTTSHGGANGKGSVFALTP